MTSKQEKIDKKEAKKEEKEQKAKMETEACSNKKHDEEIEKLTKEISHWQEMYTKALNTAAHHENLSKYYRNEYDRLVKYRAQDLIERILPVLDSFQMAFSATSSSSEVEAYKQGFQFIFRLFKSALEAEGVSEIIPSKGTTFDATIHHAVETVEVTDEKEVGKVTEALLNGYMLHDRVIRPANVKVSVLKQESVEKEEPKEESIEGSQIKEETKNESVTEEGQINKEDVTNG
jgi:molecular chaperone GrpE